ncbi:hypothetical protein CA850_26160 [Micromonospora echinospora]|uniref:DUF58 domain-containing protein n=1 Tax=Micromonospora echinospora TaxID=1877 RepID=A0A1C4VMQ8_MICEC|nr:DUF58 domain-containing protein [Micromonospora echinospora]OZV76710.1 hypothetical protein CA850_26160 [Micromonospora echinospora]SCE85230.1 Protein of unknown function DUF58 [Micromonospora echinospora]
MRRLREGTGLTGTGLAVALGSIVLLAAGALGGYPTLGGLGATGVAVVLVAAILVRMPARVRVTRTVAPHRVTVGEQVTGWLEVVNAGRLRTGRFEAVDGLAALGGRPASGPATPVDVDAAPAGRAASGRRRPARDDHGGGLRIVVPPLSPGGTTRLRYPVPTADRGVLRLGPVRLHRRDPLRLALRTQTLAAPDQVWVRPRAHPVRPLPIGPVLDFEGRLTDRVLRGSMAFAALREYRPGDDPRQIHWRSTARAGELIVQDRVDTTEPSAAVLLDTRATVLDRELFEEAVELTASVVVSTSRSGQAVDLAVLGEDVADLARLGARGPLDRLAAASRTDDGDPAELLAMVARAPAGGGLVVVSGADPGLAPALTGQTRRFGGIVLVQLVADGSAQPAAAALDSAAPPGPAGTSVSVQSGLVVIRADRARTAATAYSGLAGGRR